jgi:hypothetical protein
MGVLCHKPPGKINGSESSISRVLSRGIICLDPLLPGASSGMGRGRTIPTVSPVALLQSGFT